MKRLACPLALLLAVGTAVSLPVPALATFPGGNGEIAYWSSGGVRVIQPDGSGDRVLFPYLSDDIAFSADGTHAVVARSLVRAHLATDRLVLIDLSTGHRSVILQPSELPQPGIYSVSMSPDGGSVVFCDGFPDRHLYTIGIDGSSLAQLRHSKNYCYADWGVNGRIVATKGIFPGEGRRVVTTMDPDGGNQRVIVSFPAAKSWWHTVYVLSPSWAPDGSSVVFGAQRNRIIPDIWVVNANGSNLRDLTNTKFKSESSAVYSPDGTEVVFSRSSDLWLIHPDGSELTRLTNTPRGEYSIAWRPA